MDEITIFGYDEDIQLKDVFERMKTVDNVPDAKSDGNKLRAFFREVAPSHDEEKVYSSDIKKIITWFGILKDMPFFNDPDPAEVTVPVEEPAPVATEADTPPAEEKVPAKKKPASKKAAK